MVEAARTEATKLIEKDKNLKAHPLLSKILSTQGAEIHFE
jgi:hypothetical protein